MARVNFANLIWTKGHEMNFLLTFLLLITAFFSWSNCASIEFENKSEDNWQLLIGANSKELRYDFCRYNATSSGTQCTNFPQVASIDIRKVCHCSVQHNETEAGSFNFSVNCNSNLSWCPKNLALNYQHSSFEKPSHAEKISETTVILVLSLLVNAFLSL